MREHLLAPFAKKLQEIEAQGLFKKERIIESAQSTKIQVQGRTVLNLCANNYLGLSNDESLRESAKAALDTFGFGLSSVRFICGTQSIHKELEAKISEFLGTEDTILYISCFDANGGLFETLLGENDAVISDSLNHASIIDGVRLSKAKRFRYEHSNLEDLRDCLQRAREQRAETILITTDSVFSMDGDIARLREICDLAVSYDALVHVDECHATGFFGPTGRGAIEYAGVMDRVDIITSTLGKALGGACGGFTAARREIVELLRQRSRPYLFSNALPPSIVAAGITCLDMLSKNSSRVLQLAENTTFFREEIRNLGFTIKDGNHPIVPIMLGDAQLATKMSERLLHEGIYVIGFSYPVVPMGQARIRTQMSAAHTKEDLEQALAAFAKVGRDLGIISG